MYGGGENEDEIALNGELTLCAPPGAGHPGTCMAWAGRPWTAEPFRLEVSGREFWTRCRARGIARMPPGLGEVEIEVAAAGSISRI